MKKGNRQSALSKQVWPLGGLRLSDLLAKGAHPAFEITTSLSPGLFGSERYGGGCLGLVPGEAE